MEVREAFGKALRLVRLTRNLTQEDFSIVSSRTFVSMLERGATAPTIEKLEDLSSVLEVHPTTLLVLTYLIKHGTLDDGNASLSLIADELKQILSDGNPNHAALNR